ncbi:MAG: cytidylate kinase family protein, partial [Lachnospiraceae bacterium]|nr:cytidylate kinase family protein [Lachnospiraceae bacterium]
MQIEVPEDIAGAYFLRLTLMDGKGAIKSMNDYGFDRDGVEKSLRKKDKARANHYRYYTDAEWGKTQNYDITLNSSTCGLDGCVDVLYAIIQELQ